MCWCADRVSYLLLRFFSISYTATFISLAPVVIVELVGLEKLTNGFGLICMVRGITAIIGPPLEGKSKVAVKDTQM